MNESEPIFHEFGSLFSGFSENKAVAHGFHSSIGALTLIDRCCNTKLTHDVILPQNGCSLNGLQPHCMLFFAGYAFSPKRKQLV